MTTFYVGTNEPCWLRRERFPLFVSQIRLARYKKMPRAVTDWALDSGAFTQIKDHGRFLFSPEEYAGAALRYQSEVGRLRWAAIQDWMCEPFILKKTGLPLAEHQRRTVQSYLTLRGLAPSVRWTPVLQGWEFDDYLRCWELYEEAGVPLLSLPLVGVGSVCRRQDTRAAAAIVGRLSAEGLKLHGFGVKTEGLSQYAHLLESADSMAWSYNARRNPGKWRGEGEISPLPCTHRACATCGHYAARWRCELLGKISARNAGQWSLAI